MQKLRAFTILLFVSFAMILGSCAEDETLNEVETTLEMTADGDQEDPDEGGMTITDGEQEDPDEGGM